MKNKKQKLDALDRKGKFRHEQHTSKFNRELNSPNNNIQQPFRIMDERWVVGKFKGTKLKDTPTHYIEWVLNNFQHLSSTHKNILHKLIN